MALDARTAADVRGQLIGVKHQAVVVKRGAEPFPGG
jgi:hypothetical protein